MADSGFDFDYIVIGSGFGGSVTAHRLTEKGYRVGIMEMGRRWTPDNLPSTNWIIWKWIWRPRLALRAAVRRRWRCERARPAAKPPRAVLAVARRLSVRRCHRPIG